MANFNTNTYTGQNGSAGSSTNAAALFPLARDAGGKLRFLVIPYSAGGTETTADTITLGILPVGAKVIPALCRIVSNSTFDANDVDIGVSGNVNKYADALDTLGADSDISFGVAGDNAFVPTVVASGGETLIATLVAVTSITSAGRALFLIGYLAE